LYFNDSW